MASTFRLFGWDKFKDVVGRAIDRFKSELPQGVAHDAAKVAAGELKKFMLAGAGDQEPLSPVTIAFYGDAPPLARLAKHIMVTREGKASRITFGKMQETARILHEGAVYDMSDRQHKYMMARISKAVAAGLLEKNKEGQGLRMIVLPARKFMSHLQSKVVKDGVRAAYEKGIATLLGDELAGPTV